MGNWNGVGGKIKKGESPEEAAIREVEEETGLRFSRLKWKGTARWIVDESRTGGMHLFWGEVPSEMAWESPRKMVEGILDWKEIDWILHPANRGVADNVKYILQYMMSEEGCFEHLFIWSGDTLIEHRVKACKTVMEDFVEKGICEGSRA
jgi:8-oxo-dGTP diphosphatase